MRTILQCKMFRLKPLFIGVLVCLSFNAQAEQLQINQIKQNWVIAQEETPKAKQLEVLAKLVADAEDVYMKDRANPEANLWYGVSLASYAAAKGGMVATIHNRAARQYLKTAVKMLPDHPDANYHYGRFLAAMGEEQAAQPYLNKIHSQNGS